jgi:alkaline phosphatase D
MQRRTLLRGVASAACAFALPPAAEPASTRGTYRLIHGPMIGAVGPDRVSIHARSSACTSLAVRYSTHSDLSGAKTSTPVTTCAASDYTVRFEIEGLQPDTRYYYSVLLDGVPDPYLRSAAPFHFTTAPMPGARKSFRIAFGSCARIQYEPVQPIWDAVMSMHPDLFLWLGDNVYHDTLEPQIMDEMWRWQRSVPNLQPLLRSVPQLAIWDDHDFGLNNHDRTNPVKDLALASFRRYWANPSYGLADAPGVFFRQQYGAVDLFMLDGRYYRDPNEAPDVPGKTLLGAAQLAWLKMSLRESRATFKVLACGSGWSVAKGPGEDSWAAFLHERDALFDFIRDEAIGGVVLISGDTHVGELNCIPWSEHGGYDLYDIVSSPLAQPRADSWRSRKPERRIRPVFHADNNFGLVEIDFSTEAPRIRCNLYDTAARPAWERPLVLAASQLRNGVRSWEQA